MAKRIRLPSADELFPTPPPGRQQTTAKSTKPAAPSTSAAKKRATKKSPSRGSAVRLDTLETRIPALSVDTLIDLRDGLEELLAADSVDEDAVRELLDSIGA